ncbi:MAG: NAD-dependent epimerase/dehydratase family protein [Planctomycetota bacterium]
MDDAGPVLVTGAAGFIGSHVCRALRDEGRRVIGVDNFDPFYERATKEAALRRWDAQADAKAEALFVELDITQSEAMTALVERERPAGVIHLAAKAGVRPSLEDPTGYAMANLVGLSSVLEAARRGGAARVLFASSSSVYGNQKETPFSELDDVNQPISPYAATKRAGELVCSTHHHLYGTPIACLRFFTVFGPGQRPDLAVSKFLRLIASGQPIQMFGNGATSRDYTYVDDIVSGVLAAYRAIDTHGYRVWNLGSDTPLRLDAMIDTVARVVGQPAHIEHAPAQMGDVEQTWADLTRSRAELGYAPATTFEDGVRAQWAAR